MYLDADAKLGLAGHFALVQATKGNARSGQLQSASPSPATANSLLAALARPFRRATDASLAYSIAQAVPSAGRTARKEVRRHPRLP